MNPNADERNMERIMIVKVIAALMVISLISLQLLSYPLKIDGSSYINNVVYAVGEGKPISIKLNYAHFAPLTNNSKSHQVKVIVLYTVMPSSTTINMAQNAMMKVYALNGTLLKTTSFPGGLKINATGGKAQLATTLSDSRIKNITASLMFTDSSKSANFSNPLNVKLNLGQTIQP
jgi:hypothetical protein